MTESTVILPGDTLIDLGDATTLGPGLFQAPLSKPVPVKAGYLMRKEKGHTGSVYIESNSRRYVPSVKDHVIGVVVGRQTEGFRVLLQDASPSVRLGQFAFENANKKNRPNLPVGALVYGRITMADKDIEAEMECYDSNTGKAAGFGELKGGYVVQVSLAYARKLLFEGSPLLSAIGDIVPFEIAIGMNGKIWIDAPDNTTIFKIAQCIEKSETLSEHESVDLVSKLLSGKKTK
ncbi:Rrp40p [Sugiyamaella lignohabitans]|uniref:Ribosomal RNA-processing protein 40 n=1 Tax=Sugiyamaella lignohabitans TaxID=796027 RepID=A0A170QZF0_9ASCO|nr:Rrp40p [Sugiyamaella lignohabitans]ANB16009.1 Rrp40p [Sugiyamaella lignohabitans]